MPRSDQKPQKPADPKKVSPGDPFRVLLLATSNQGKVREYKALLKPLLVKLSLNLLTLGDLKARGFEFPEAREGAQSFTENAFLKARHYADLSSCPTLADDSGLCVLALDGAPGVLSARYGAVGLTDPKRSQKLLTDLDKKLLSLNTQNKTREAYFETALVLAKKGLDNHLAWTGRLHGSIAAAPKGAGGFGYDPIFIPRGYDQTLAELSLSEKNRLSHRGEAIFKALKDSDLIDAFLGQGE
ncbi:MAG: non-canonical purine NTP pyrophosphatase [Deltaproteobacteria bacterium]|jgi:XTP/dITP diphosphohydrolase|nr:non-canonical purine NTP pyrophosphatase [Deltaproteobacteria bacterium]